MNTYHHGRPMPKLATHKTKREIRFICHAPQAHQVSLVGDFNNWDPKVNPMRQMPDQAWFVALELGHGHHRYAFWVDGVVTLDPNAQGVTRNDKGERVSLVPVS